MHGVTLKLAEQATTSYFWGAPPNYKGATWPHGRRMQSAGDKKYPLSFVACIDAGEVHKYVPWLPESGRLLFFYDEEDQPWGLYPEEREGWRVICIEEGDLLPGFCEEPAGLGDFAAVAPVYLRFGSDSLMLRLKRLWRRVRGKDAPRHRIGGAACKVQDDEMPAMCQFLSNGFRLENVPDLTEEIAEMLVQGISDWRLLLQIDTDDDLGSMWGDCGRLYFWVREQESRACDFRNVWMFLQSH